MTEVKSYVCPNCGANTTNTQNCDYCGSLLVRFVERNIDLSGTAYLNNDKVLPGLIKHLEQNLTLQKNSEDCVATDINWKTDTSLESMSVMRQGWTVWKDKTDICITDQTQGLLVLISFDQIIDHGHDDFYNHQMIVAEEKFKKLPSFNLFTPHRCFCENDDGDKYKSSQYAIYFGNDVEGAARIVSEVLEKVFDVNLNDNSIEIYTNSGDNIDKCRKKVDDNFSKEEDSTFSIFGLKWYWWVLLVIWLWICFS